MSMSPESAALAGPYGATPLLAAVEAGRLAPSTHNTQPWRFDIRDGAVDLYADPGRGLPVLDPGGRDLTISCGAALYNIRLAVEAAGRAPLVTLRPEPRDATHLARVECGEPQPVGPGTPELLAAVPLRRTNRMPFEARALPTALLVEFERLAALHGVQLRHVQRPGERRALAAVIQLADSAQMSNAAFRAELAAWTRADAEAGVDGVPDYAMGFGSGAAYATPFALRNFDVAGRLRAVPAGSGTEEPAVVALVSAGDRAIDWLRTGEALQHVLLEACRAGVGASYLNQPVELPALREVVRDELRLDGFPQLILRLGYGLTGAATPRRPLDDVLGHGPGDEPWSGARPDDAGEHGRVVLAAEAG